MRAEKFLKGKPCRHLYVVLISLKLVSAYPGVRLSLNPSSVAYWLCILGKVLKLHVLVISFVKWE